MSLGVLEAANSFVISPSWVALLWMAAVICALVGALVTVLKGRWGWALIGLLTGGLLWLGTAFLAPKPRSPWIRLAERRRRR